MPILLLVASLSLNGLISISAHPMVTEQECIASGRAAIAKLTEAAGNLGSGPASYACYQAKEAGVLGVVAYVRPEDNLIAIREGVKPTADACGEMGKRALATKVVPGAMSWACFQIPSK